MAAEVADELEMGCKPRRLQHAEAVAAHRGHPAGLDGVVAIQVDAVGVVVDLVLDQDLQYQLHQVLIQSLLVVVVLMELPPPPFCQKEVMDHHQYSLP